MTNFLVVVADQLRADALGALGNAMARTPNLDRQECAASPMSTTRPRCHGGGSTWVSNRV